MAITFTLTVHNETNIDFSLDESELAVDSWEQAPPPGLPAGDTVTMKSQVATEVEASGTEILVMYNGGGGGVSIRATGNPTQYGNPTGIVAFAAGAVSYRPNWKMTSNTNPFAGEVTIQ